MDYLKKCKSFKVIKSGEWVEEVRHGGGVGDGVLTRWRERG